ncbi:hypothetical protein [Metapseudomonas resinovorans]|uniref:hypothetical protein n=1 Tax=Metapseudomonas resinovorans TaxID=53412 RepID=UPI0003F52973|nr:hypothetical protein [Pseudomonas resinovorans]
MEELICWFERHPGTAGWVQAVGSIIALVAVIGVAWWQNQKALRLIMEQRIETNRQLIEAFTAIARTTRSHFLTILDTINQDSPAAFLNSVDIAATDRVIAAVDAFPFQQLPTFNTINGALHISQVTHLLRANLDQMLFAINHGGDLAAHVSEFQTEFFNLCNWVEAFIVEVENFHPRPQPLLARLRQRRRNRTA